MRKIAIFIALIALSISSKAQVWSQVGNTLQRQTNGTYNNYRFNLGSPGFVYFYSKPQVDSAIANGATYTAGYGLGLTAFQFRLDSTVAVNKTFFNTVIGTATLNRLSNYVPYNGATSNINIGSHNLTTTGSGTFNNFVQSRNLSITNGINQISVSYSPSGISGFRTQYLQDKSGTFAYLDDITSALAGYVPTTRSINTTNGLLGGGNLSSDLTLQVDSTKYQTIANFFPKGDTRYQSKTIINIKDYGAKGDSLTNNTTAIQNAIDNAPNGSTIYVPSGTYLTNQINIIGRRNLTIAGNGRLCLILGTNKALFLIRHSYNVTVSEVQLTGIGDLAPGYTATYTHVGIWADSSNFVTVRNCLFNKFNTVGVWCENMNGSTFTEGMQIYNNTFVDFSFDTEVGEQNQYAIYLGPDGEYVNINHNNFYRCVGAIRCNDGANTTISENIIMQSKMDHAAAGIYTDRALIYCTSNSNDAKIRIINNRINHNEKNSLQIICNGGGAEPHYDIQGNHILVYGSGVSADAILLNNNIGSTIIGNYFLPIGFASIPGFVVKTNQCDSTLVDNNTFYGGQYSIELSNSNIKLGQNNFYNYTIKPVGVTSGTTGTIVGIAAGGDLSGTYPSPTVATINGITKSYYDVTSSIQTQLNGKQAQLNGTGFVKMSGTTISYDNSTYLTASTGVSNITGTPNQVIASSSTGAVTLSLPQPIATSSTLQFAKLGIGTSATRFLDVLGTTEQMRLAYDATHYVSHTVDASGNLTIAPSGGNLNITGAITSNASTGNFVASSAASSPSFQWNYLSGGTDAKYADIVAGGNVMFFRFLNDAKNSANNWLVVNRSGTTATGMAFTANNFSFSGNTNIVGNVGILYDGTHYTSLIPTSTGNLSIIPTGGAVNITGTLTATGLSLNQNISSPAWGILTPSLNSAIKTLTDNSTAASGTVSAVSAMVAGYMAPTLAATNTGVTYTTAATMVINGSPIAGTNVTITNPYSLYVTSGVSYFGGNVTLNSLATGTSGTDAILVNHSGVIGSIAANSYLSSSGGTLTGAISAPSFNPNSTQSTVSGSTSGSILAWQPFQGTTYKMVFIKVTSLNGSATYTYPSGFTAIPFVTQSGGSITVDTSSNSQVVVTSTGNSGYIKIEGY